MFSRDSHRLQAGDTHKGRWHVVGVSRDEGAEVGVTGRKERGQTVGGRETSPPKETGLERRKGESGPDENE